jgi:hypothetical protein
VPQEPVRKTIRTKELAAALDCDPRTMVKATKASKIPAFRMFRIDREFRFDQAAVRVALSNNAKSNK